ncbi:MAG: hypothetical protein V8S14_04805 [Lachnospiraceae bacterium]
MCVSSDFSHDSKSAPEEMILGAIAKGLQAVCFTTHDKKMILHGDRRSVLTGSILAKVMPPLQTIWRQLMYGSV